MKTQLLLSHIFKEKQSRLRGNRAAGMRFASGNNGNVGSSISGKRADAPRARKTGPLRRGMGPWEPAGAAAWQTGDHGLWELTGAVSTGGRRVFRPEPLSRETPLPLRRAGRDIPPVEGGELARTGRLQADNA